MQTFQNPERDYIYKLIYKYYNDPIMTKIKDINEEFSMYVCQLPCLLMNEKRFLIAITLIDTFPIEHTNSLSNLRWKSFMARSLNDESLHNLPIHNYTIKRDSNYTIGLKIKSRSKDISIYNSDLGVFNVSLLHCKNQEYEYPNEGNLVSALETFQTIIQWE